MQPTAQAVGVAENPNRAPEGRKKRKSRYMSVLRVEDRRDEFLWEAISLSSLRGFLYYLDLS